MDNMDKSLKDILNSTFTLHNSASTPNSASEPAPPVHETLHVNTAPHLLEKAAEHMKERGRQYDRPAGERSMGRAVSAFNTITGQSLSESEGWLLLQVLKDVRDRQRGSPHRDSLEDCIAYAALKAEARLSEKIATQD
jgi:hypothetical protein